MRKAVLFFLSVASCPWAAGGLSAQSQGPTNVAEEIGSGELNVTYQSFYNRINNSTIANVAGAGVSFLHFFPKRGLLSLRLEPLADRGGFTTGENYAQWKGLPWKGHHWDFALGDFRVNAALQPMPFANLIQPSFYLRGGSVTARTGTWRYSFYGGFETLSQGQRVPFRERVPQNGLGAETAGEPLEWMEVGFRYLHLTSTGQDVLEQPPFFPLNRQFIRSDSLTAQTNIKLGQNLEWYTETGWNSAEKLRPSGPRHSAFSFVTGPSWKTPHIVIQANYVRQGTGYLPVLGYFLGDRQGPNAEGILRLGRLELSGSWGQSRNNLERDPEMPDFLSRQASGGISVRLPFKFALSASISKIDLETRSAGLSPRLNDNRQLNLSLSRPLFRHNLRAAFQQLDVQFENSVQRLRFLEFEDNYHWKRFAVGGAARWQHFVSSQRKDSLFFRGTAQVQFRHFSVYSYLEQGKDLANSTLFATNAISTSVAGFSWDAPQRMTVQVEAFRNNLNSNLNPESAFVLAGRGIPLDTTLSRFNNWSLYVRVTRHFGWGERLSLDARGEVQRQAPLIGTLAGFVKLQTMAGEYGAPEIYVAVDSGREVKTDANGYFEIPEIPQGTHIVSLDLDRLPADFNAMERTQASALVRPDQATRVEFTVIPLQMLPGRVVDTSGKPAPEGVVIRLSPGDQYTTTDKLGEFGFYNLPEGDYVVTIEEKSLPDSARLTTPAQLPVKVRFAAAPLVVNFVYEIVEPEPKPIQKVLTGERRVM